MRRTLFVLAGLALLAACQRASSTQSEPPSPAPLAEASLARVPLGAPPGQPGTPASAMQNPFEGDAAAVAQGKALFSSMNCVYCHGAGGSGLIGPPLDGHGWRYGGAPAQLFNSIHDGRPQGMPAWGDKLPDPSIWQIVAYLETFGGAAPPATPAMTKLGGPHPSATGPEIPGESPSDAAAAAHARNNAKPAR